MMFSKEFEMETGQGTKTPKFGKGPLIKQPLFDTTFLWAGLKTVPAKLDLELYDLLHPNEKKQRPIYPYLEQVDSWHEEPDLDKAREERREKELQRLRRLGVRPLGEVSNMGAGVRVYTVHEQHKLMTTKKHADRKPSHSQRSLSRDKQTSQLEIHVAKLVPHIDLKWQSFNSQASRQVEPENVYHQIPKIKIKEGKVNVKLPTVAKKQQQQQQQQDKQCFSRCVLVPTPPPTPRLRRLSSTNQHDLLAQIDTEVTASWRQPCLPPAVRCSESVLTAYEDKAIVSQSGIFKLVNTVAKSTSEIEAARIKTQTTTTNVRSIAKQCEGNSPHATNIVLPCDLGATWVLTRAQQPFLTAKASKLNVKQQSSQISEVCKFDHATSTISYQLVGLTPPESIVSSADIQPSRQEEEDHVSILLGHYSAPALLALMEQNKHIPSKEDVEKEEAWGGQYIDSFNILPSIAEFMPQWKSPKDWNQQDQLGRHQVCKFHAQRATNRPPTAGQVNTAAANTGNEQAGHRGLGRQEGRVTPVLDLNSKFLPGPPTLLRTRKVCARASGLERRHPGYPFVDF